MIDENRSLAIRVVLVCAIGVGAWNMLVKPLHRKAQTLRAEVGAALEEITSGEVVINTSAGDPQAVLTSLRERASAYESWWAGPEQNARLYDSVRDVARAAGVQLVGVEPGRTQTHIIAQHGAEDETLLRIESFIIDATGAFGPILDLISSIQRDLGVVRIESFTVGPFDNAGTLQIQLTTTRYIFERPFPSIQSSQSSEKTP